MNRAQLMLEVFEPSDERPVPPLIPVRREEEDVRYFYHTLTLARGTFTTGVTYNVYHIAMAYIFPRQFLNIIYTKNEDINAQSRLLPRTFQEIEDDTKDLYKVFRVISQMIMDIRRRYTVRFLGFASPIRFADLLKQFDRLVQSIAYKLNGTIYPPVREIDTYGEISQGYRIRLPLPGVGTRLRNRFRTR